MAEKKSAKSSAKKPAKKPASKAEKVAKPEKTAKPTKAVESEKVEKVEKSEKPAEQKPQKSKKGLFAGLAVLVLAAIFGIAMLLVNSNKVDPSDPAAKLSYTNAFFVYDNNKNTLWNEKGERVTEDEYSDATSFVGGYAYVKKDGQYGIIKDNGQMSVEFGKYGNITNKGGLYLAQDGNTKEYFLLTGSGTVLARGSDLEIFTASATSGFAAVETENKIKVFNYAGKLMAEMSVADDASDPVLSS